MVDGYFHNYNINFEIINLVCEIRVFSTIYCPNILVSIYVFYDKLQYEFKHVSYNAKGDDQISASLIYGGYNTPNY